VRGDNADDAIASPQEIPMIVLFMEPPGILVSSASLLKPGWRRKPENSATSPPASDPVNMTLDRLPAHLVHPGGQVFKLKKQA
jgi:hypothetical protein